MTDRGHGPAPPASAALLEKLNEQATLDAAATAADEVSGDYSAVDMADLSSSPIKTSCPSG